MTDVVAHADLRSVRAYKRSTALGIFTTRKNFFSMSTKMRDIKVSGEAVLCIDNEKKTLEGTSAHLLEAYSTLQTPG